MLNKIWRWFTSLFCNHQWVNGVIVLRNLKFYQKQWCPICGKKRIRKYVAAKCPHCGWYYRLRALRSGVYSKICVNNECPNFMDRGDDE